ncbi:UNVERIFIED_CONTAM: hypothetical protein PYX00_003166 [Menopon gallinae]
MAKTAVDAQFLSEFYNNSRLHHLSTMGAMFKQYVGELKEKSTGIFPGRKRISEWFERDRKERVDVEITDRVVAHIDMDCFFVSVALRNNPELKGKPVAVAHARGNPTHQRDGVNPKFEYNFYRRKMGEKLGLEEDESSSESDGEGKPWLSEFSSRSEVASCSYEAREAGVRNGMYLGSALRLCPELKTVPYDFEGYKEVSYTLYNTVAEYTLDIEAVSCDELYIDCTSLIREMRMKPLDLATILRRDIQERTECPSSVGIGSNKLQARLATKRAKPNGQFYLQPVEVLNFMSEVDVYDLPGVGRSMGYKLKSLNVRTCLDLQNVPLSTLKKEFGGKTGDTLYKHCRGIDERLVNSSHQRKSVSAEVNYGIRFQKEEEATTFFKQLSAEVSNRLKEVNLRGRNITLKIMIRAKDAPAEAAKFLGHGACDYVTRSHKMQHATDNADLIAKHVLGLYSQLSVPASELRGIGIQVTKLENCKPATGGIKNFLKPKIERAEAKPALTAEVPRIPVETEKLQLPPMSQIDQDVFDSLPEELKKEILNDLAAAGATSAAPERKDHAGSTDNVFIGLSLADIRKIIEEWVVNEDNPKAFDVDMMLGYAIDLIHKKRLEDVDILVKCFHRHVWSKRDSPNWRKTYAEVVRRLQSSMKTVFGKEMFIQEI